MKTLLPRLQVSDETAARLRQLADHRGINLGQAIEAILEARMAKEAHAGDETLYRLILAGERYGLTVGGTRLFPASWVDVGGLTEEACRHLAESYIKWRGLKN